MLTDTKEGRELLNEAAYRLVSEQAPAELPLYVAARDRYLADPQGAALQAEATDRPLGFGAATAVQTLVQAVFPLLVPALTYVLQKAVEALKEETTEQIVARVKALFGKTPRPQPIFDQKALRAIEAEIARLIEHDAVTLSLDEAQVERIKHALIARLALAAK